MSGTVEERIVTTVNSGNNNTVKAKRDVIAIGQVNKYISIYHEKPKECKKIDKQKIMEQFGLM